MNVTDHHWNTKAGTPRIGFYMDSILAQNLAPIGKFVKRDFGVLGLITGSGQTRVGKSRKMFALMVYIDWCIRGGEMDFERHFVGDKSRLKYPSGRIKKYPTKPSTLSWDNVVFSVDEVKETSDRKENYSVIGLDEGLRGNEAIGSNSKTNRDFSEFLDEVGQKNQVFLFVCPNFFKLNEEICTNRSLFLIDCYLDKDYRRGFFNYYNREQKDFLYNAGKRRLGLVAKYRAGYSTFSGRFIDFEPWPIEEYNIKKKESLALRVHKSKRVVNDRIERNCVIKMYKRATKKEHQEIAAEMSEELDKKVTTRIIDHAIHDFKEHQEKIDELNAEKK